MKKIKLTQDKYALVDDEDYEWLSKKKWYFESSNGYAVNKNAIKIYMHRLINQTPDSLVTDHINRDRLDNRKINLRSVNSTQNIVNTKIRSDNKSGYKGVFWRKDRKKWSVYFNINKLKRIYCGHYKNLSSAIKARKHLEQTYEQYT